MNRRFQSICISIAAVTLLAACNKQESPSSSVRPAVVMTVEDGAASGLMAYSGEVRARHEADLGFRMPGKLVERLVNLGDRVHKGQVLARIDPQDAQLLASAAQAQVSAAVADAALAKAEYERAQSLFEQKFISGSAVDTRRTQLEAAQARLQQARSQSSVSGNQLGYTSLLADRDGVITAATAEAGQVVAAGQVVFRLADPAEREVLIWIPEARIKEIKPGLSALIRPWSAQDKMLKGVVREVAASADATTRTYAVRVRVLEADESLKLGSTASAAFERDVGVAQISIPLPALMQKDGAASVWIVDAQNTVQLRAVDIAEMHDEVAFVRNGLVRGDRVVILGAHALKAGMEVRPIPQQAPVTLDVKR